MPTDLNDLIHLIPGYDPEVTAGDSRFDPESAQRSLDFFPDFLRHAEGDLYGKPFVLEPWQQAIVANLFGWKRTDSQGRTVRRYRESLLYVPRKSGKTPLAAGLGLLSFFYDRERGAQCYIAAGEREQAGMLFRHARSMVEQQPRLNKLCEIYGGNAAAGQSKSLFKPHDGSYLRVISADASGQHGGNTHLAIIDELHVQPNRELVDVMRTSMASQNRAQPLLLYITTADYGRESICNEVYDYACKVRDGIIEDAAFLPVIYEAAREDDWTSEDIWRKANPNLGVSVSLDYLKRECQKAQEIPAYENTFKRLHLNIITEQENRVIPMDQWERCGQGADPVEWRASMLESLRGTSCTAGLDLGSISDLTALSLLFGNDDDGYDVLPFFWTPQDNAHKRELKDRVPYLAWMRQGFIAMNDGNETDYKKVQREINELANQYGITVIAADRVFQGAQICQDLLRDGLNVVDFGQGYLSMAAPTRRFLELVAAGKLRHGNNPVLKWMASNAASEADNGKGGEVLKFSKRKSSEKIDGIIATTMALGMAATADPGVDHSYEQYGNLTL